MFDLDTWRKQVPAVDGGLRERLNSSGANFLWSLLAGTALWPLAGAFAGDPSVLVEFLKIVPGIGASLIASRLNEWKNMVYPETGRSDCRPNRNGKRPRGVGSRSPETIASGMHPRSPC